MKTACEVSVIIPTYNRGRLLERAVKSVITQSNEDLEILVCDDGSTDDSFERIAAFKDERIRWIDGERGGRPAIPRNRGLANARGEWIAFLDSDDWWEHSKLERQICALKKENLSACCTNAWIADRSGKQVGLYFKGSVTRKVGLSKILEENIVICSSVILSSMMGRQLRFPEEIEYIAVEDFAFWIGLLQMTDILYLSDPLLSYSTDTETSIRKEQKTSLEIIKRKMVLRAFGHALSKIEFGNAKVLVRQAMVGMLEESKIFFQKLIKLMKSASGKKT